MQLSRLRDRVRSSLWFTPAVFGLVAIVLAIGTIWIDRRVEGSTLVGFGGGPESARSVLSTVAASTITFAGLVFSITVVALQLASSQFSPRVLRTFLRDRTSKVALGVTIGTFTYALLVLQAIRSEGSAGGEFVPEIAVSLSLVLAVAAIGTFIRYIHHISQSIQASRVLDAVAAETTEAIERLRARDPGATPPEPPAWVHDVAATRDGVVVGIGEETLAEIAASNDCVVEVQPAVGDPVVEGMTVLRFSAELSDGEAERARRSIELAPERTMQQDIAFGVRQLVDIAERALSPGVNDPTTAVQAIDRLHGVLRRLAGLPLGERWMAGGDGSARVSIREPSWDDLLALALDEIRIAGAGSVQISRRLRALLDDVIRVAPPDHDGSLRRQLRLLDASDGRAFSDREDLELAAEPDPQGMGGARSR